METFMDIDTVSKLNLSRDVSGT